MKRHALLAYFVLAFAIAWGGILLVARSTGLPAAVGTPVDYKYLVFLAMIAGPSLASLALTASVDGRRGLRDLGRRLVRWRIGGRWYTTLLIAPVTLAIVLAILSTGSAVFVPPIVAGAPAATILAYMLVAGLGAGFFEELGWTGFATPRLLARHGVVGTGLILGPLWAAWHGLSDFWGSASTFGPLWIAHMLEWFVALTAFRILMTWVYSNTRSLLLGVLLHASFTGGQALLWPTGVSARDEVLWYGLFAVALWGVVGVLVAGRQMIAQPVQGAR